MTRTRRLMRKLFCFCVLAVTVLLVLYNRQGDIILGDIGADQNNNHDSLFFMLEKLDRILREKTSENNIYGNIYNGKRRQQVLTYMNTNSQFSRAHKIRTICEIGFAGGHSAVVFLYMNNNANYVGFDDWNRKAYKEEAIKWLKMTFENREIRIIKGDSTKTVPQFNETCDLIHINGAHHDHYPLADMKNMHRLASKHNLLLIDDCSKSWPAVRKGVQYLQEKNLASFIDMFEDKEWVFRDSNKGWCIGSYIASENETIKSDHSATAKRFTFFGQSFCGPLWTGTNCSIPVQKHCSSISDQCFYSAEYGTLSVSCWRWRNAQSAERETWDKRRTNTDRNEAHAKSFDNYNSLPYELGDVIEVGAGPFTQSQTILKGRRAKSVTLIEPMANHYITNVKECFYRNCNIKNLPTTIVSLPAEEIKPTRKFDTLIMINVIEHVYDGLSILKTAVDLIKHNGIFIWHERIWDSYTGNAESKDDREFKLHPIRIKTVIAKLLMSSFETMYISWDTGELRRLKNQGVYFIGRKRDFIGGTSLFKHLECIEKGIGIQDFIFFVGNSNYTFVENQIIIAINSINLRSIIFVLTEEISSTVLSRLLKYDKIKIILSHHHLNNWKNEVSSYTTPCESIISEILSDTYDNVNTICIGHDNGEHVTVVLMGRSLKRLKNYEFILPAYSKMKQVLSIIVVWNNKKELFQSKFKSLKLVMVYPEVNSMNNRFNVSYLIKTDAVLVIDDDVLLSEPLLEHMLLRWNKNTDRLLGITPDMRYVNSKQEYSTHGSDAVIAIGKTMLFHRKYLDLYMKDKILVAWNHKLFCEDISMNALIRNSTKLKPLFIEQTGNRKRQNLPESDGVSINRRLWPTERTECVRFVYKHFNLTF